MFGILNRLLGTKSGSDQPQVGSVFDTDVVAADGSSQSLKRFSGNALLIVNTASRCGFTGQYKSLESLYQTYHQRGLWVLAFPSNDFRGQEPGSNQEIQEFCQLNYGVSFPVFGKAPVKGDSKQPLFRLLTEESRGDLRGPIRWNFEKFLVNRRGELVARWRSVTSPSSSSVIKAIESVLDEKDVLT